MTRPPVRRQATPAAAPSAVPGAPAAPAQSLIVRARLAKLRERIAADHVLAQDVLPFLAAGVEWEEEGQDAIGRIGPRWCRVSREEVSFGNQWPGTKRVPL